MAEIASAAPTALQRARSHMRDSQSQQSVAREQTSNTRGKFRESVHHFMTEENVSRVPITRKDLQELTDAQIFVSHSFLNFATFACVVAVTFSLGYMGWGRDITGDYKSIHDQYQTLVTHVFWSNIMWVVIFALEAVFVLYQLLPAYKNLPIIEKSIDWWFVAVNGCQMGWIIAYCFDVIWLAALFMAANIGSLSMLNAALYNTEYVDKPVKEGSPESETRDVPEELLNFNFVVEYIVFRMPFQMHLGWAIFVFLVNVNEIWAKYELAQAGIIAIVSVILLWIFCIVVLFVPKHPLFMIPPMIAWGAIGIWIELSNPRFGIFEAYDDIEINRVQGGAIATAVEHIFVPIIKFAIHFATTYKIMEKQE